MSLFLIKAVAALSILVVGLIGGWIPLAAARRPGSRRFFSLGNALAGGIFLGAGFIHLLPESMEAFEEISEYPFGALLAAAGVGLLLLIDRVVYEMPGKRSSEKATEKPVHSLVLLVVLSVHSIIAGAALGLESAVSTSILVMFGILFHKGSAAFALIVSAFSMGADKKRLRTVLWIFVAMTPLGIVLGTLASSLLEGPEALLFEAIFNALAAGTFIYVAILDVINAEMSSYQDRLARFTLSTMTGGDDLPFPTEDSDRLLKFCLVIIGLSSMAVLGLWV